MFAYGASADEEAGSYLDVAHRVRTQTYTTLYLRCSFGGRLTTWVRVHYWLNVYLCIVPALLYTLPYILVALMGLARLSRGMTMLFAIPAVFALSCYRKQLEVACVNFAYLSLSFPRVRRICRLMSVRGG